MQVRCPHCHCPNPVSDDSALSNLTCPSCGSTFSLVDDTATATYRTEIRSIGHFELIEQLGTGRFGSVFQARDQRLDRTVAVKIPRKENLQPEEIEGFFREARAAAQLRHPHIVPVHEVGRENGTVYIVSEYIAGANLREWLTGRRMSVRESAELCAKLAEALQHAHEAGVIHRDLKPGNIMMDFAGEPHLMDFGLARREMGEVTMTLDGQILGTPAYMSPEQARGEGHGADRRTDIYSLGTILYELLTGEVPFRGEARMLIVQIIQDEPPSPRKLKSHIPRDLETICLKCLQKEPARRYQTARELAEDLRRFLAAETILARPVGRFERTWRWCRRNPVLAALTAGIAATLLAGAAVSTYFALQAQARADDATSERNRADAKANESRANARRADAQAIESQTNALRAEQETIRANAKTDEARRNLYAAHLGLAVQAWKAGNFAVARELLEKHIPQSAADDLRTFEWFLLWRLCHWRNVRVFRDHEQVVAAVAYAPDGRLASAGGDRAVRIRDPQSGRIARTLWERSPVSSLAFSPDGSLLATAAGSRVRLWRVETGEVVRDVSLPAGGVIRHIAFSPDGRFFAACTGDIVGRTTAVAVVWDTASGQQQLELKSQTSVFGVTFSPDGHQFVTAGGSYFAESELKTWEFPAGTGRATLDGHSGVVYDARFTRDGKTLVTSGSDTTLRIWDVDAGRQVGRLDGHAHEVQGIDLSDDGALVASASGDATARVWDIHNHMPVRTLGGHLANVTHVAFAPGSSELATSSADGTVRVWDLTRPPGDQVLHGHEHEVRRVHFSRDGSRVATADFGGVIKFWDAATGELQKTLAAGAGLDDFAFTPDGSRIAAWAERTVSLWTLADDSRRILRDEIDVASLGFSPQGELLAVSTAFWQSRDPGVILVLDASTGRELRSIPAPHVEAFAFSSDGARMVTASRNGDVKLWDVASGAEQRSMRHSPNLRCVALSHDDRLIATGGTDGLVVVFDAKSGERVFALAGHRSYVYGVAFIDNSRTLATSSWDGTVRFWDMISGQERMTLPAHRAGLWSLGFSPDGRLMVTASRDHTARLWTAASDREVEQDRTESLLDMAYYQLVQEKWDAAADGYGRVVDSDPQSWDAWYGRGRARAMLKESEAAESDLSQAIELRPDHAPAWAERSGVRLALGRPEQSLTDVSRAIELEPCAPQLRSRRGWLLAQSGRWPEAAAEYEQAISQQPDNRSLLQPLAISQLASGDLEGYKRTCRQGIEQFSGATGQAANDVAWLCAVGPDALPDLTGAVALARTAVPAPSVEAADRHSFLNTLGAVLYRAGDHQEAINTLNEALDAHGSGGTVWDWVFLAMAHHRLGQADEARQWLRKVREAIQGGAAVPASGSGSWLLPTELKVLHEEAQALIPHE